MNDVYYWRVELGPIPGGRRITQKSAPPVEGWGVNHHCVTRCRRCPASARRPAADRQSHSRVGCRG